jgi:MFS family permease
VNNVHIPTKSNDKPHENWDAKYELKAVSLLSLGFGLVGLDRFIINPLFPVISKDLGLNYQDLGLISAVLALCWGLSSIYSGNLSDKVGRKKVLIPAVIIFSILVACSGLATGLGSLIMIRGLMGLAEGAYVPASIVATVEASKPTRVGLNIGIQQMAAPLVGLGLGPIVAVEMLNIVPSWHYVFGVVAIPGLAIAYFMHKHLKDEGPHKHHEDEIASHWKEVFQYKNVIFNTLGMFCWLSCLIVLSAFMPNYLTDYLKLSIEEMGMVLSGLGLGSFIGMVFIPAISDKLGRKKIMIASLLLELVALWFMMEPGKTAGELFLILFVVTFMNAGVVAITVGPMTSDSVPKRLATTATGIVIGLGEVVGGAIAPAISGGIAQNLGIQYIPMIAFVAIAVGIVVAVFGIREPVKA